MYSLGIDIGSSSVKTAVLDNENNVLHTKYILHKGNVPLALQEAIGDIIEKFDTQSITTCMASGSGSDFLHEQYNMSIGNETPAILEGALSLNPDIDSIIEIGSQNAKYITNLLEGKSRFNYSMNNNCAAGTGSFFEDQMVRLGLKLEDYSSFSQKAVSIPRIAGRCSVFAKTDIIHRQQEGVPSEDIMLGLAYAVIKNYKGTIIKNNPIKPPVFMVGGVGHNESVIRAIKDVLNLSDEEFVINKYFAFVQAIGTAIIAIDGQQTFNIEHFLKSFSVDKKHIKSDISFLPKLDVQNISNDGLHNCKEITQNTDYILGIDVGSISTNLVIIDFEGNVVDFQYLRTKGDPKRAVEDGLESIKKRFGDSINIIKTGTTGSARYLIGKLVGAEVVKDEITAQAKAAMWLDPLVDTIFEIGGQDSKYIKCENGKVVDFQMNKICAAGTGSFLEEQANKFNISIYDFGQLALEANNPVDLGERCTVFIETNISSCLSQGISMKDIVAGLCYSVVRNYLNKVVGNKPLGKRILLQGAVANNPGIIAAFRHFCGESLGVTPFFSVTGAYGVALLAMEESIDKKTVSSYNDLVYKKTEELFLKNYDMAINQKKQTIGIPRVLMIHKMFPFFNRFFKELDLNVLLSENSNENIIALSQQYTQEETCYPVKLIHGHMASLAEKNVDYIFLPSIYTMKHDHSKVRRNYGCVYMQIAPKFVAHAVNLKEKNIELINPILSLDFGKEHFAKEMFSVGKKLGKNKAQIAVALAKAAFVLNTFSKEVELLGEQVINELEHGEIAFVLITRNYGLTDPVLSMGIGETIMNMGYKVLSLPHLPAHDIDVSRDHPNMYWPFGQHILSGAKIVRKHPCLYAVYITNHGCGPDTMIAPLFREEMGDKPYLAIEVDEHASSVGVITRIEAFINSLRLDKKTEKVEPIVSYKSKLEYHDTDIVSNISGLSKDKDIFLPHLYPYSRLYCEFLKQQGYNANELPATSLQSLNVGRSFTVSKEYLSFTALLGDVISFVEQNEIKSQNSMQFLLFQTEGSESDGQYSRLIRTKLDELGHKDVSIISPRIERVFDKDGKANVWALLPILAGDIILSAPHTQREELIDRVIMLIASNNLTEEEIYNLAKMVTKNVDEKKILIVGEPACMFNSILNNGILNNLEREGYGIYYSPLSEYLRFLWNDSEIDIVGQTQYTLFTKIMDNVFGLLGKSSPFSHSFEGLVEIANEKLPLFSGANGRYRYAKLSQGIEEINGIIGVSSMYENTSTILNLISGKTKHPLLTLEFDGNPNKNDELKLTSFLYYI